MREPITILTNSILKLTFSEQLACSISAYRYLCIHKKEYTLEMNSIMSRNNPDNNRNPGARNDAIVNVVHPIIGRPQMVDSNTITEINQNSGKSSFEEPPTYGQCCSYQSV